MKETVNLYRRRELIGRITNDNGILSYESLTEEFIHPACFYNNFPFNKKLPKNIPSERIYQFLDGRVPEEGRHDLIDILETLNINIYDPWRIFIKTSGMTYSDDFWIDTYGAKTFDDHLRNKHDYPGRDEWLKETGADESLRYRGF